MAIENFTTYDETDEGTNVTVAANTVSWNDLTRSHTSHVSNSKDPAHFSGDFIHKFECQFSDVVSNAIICFWALANAQSDFRALITGGADAHIFHHYQATTIRLRLLENGSIVEDLWASAVSGTTYFVTISRDDDGGANNTGQLTAEIHTGDYHPAGVHKDLLTVDAGVGEQNDFEFIFGLMSYDDFNVADSADGFTQNLDLGEEEPPVGMAGAMTTNTGYWGY